MSTKPSPAVVMVNSSTDALIIVDMQSDFLLPDAPLVVRNGVKLIPAINKLSSTFAFRHQVATQDWHPAGHCSFRSQGGQWPVHCCRGTTGSALHPDLRTDHLHTIFRKGNYLNADSYSAFADEHNVETGLAGLLKSLGVRRVFVVGVAYDYCVFQTAMSAKKAGFEVVIVSDLCAAVSEATAQERTKTLQEAGVQLINSMALRPASKL